MLLPKNKNQFSFMGNYFLVIFDQGIWEIDDGGWEFLNIDLVKFIVIFKYRVIELSLSFLWTGNLRHSPFSIPCQTTCPLAWFN